VSEPEEKARRDGIVKCKTSVVTLRLWGSGRVGELLHIAALCPMSQQMAEAKRPW